jgi:CTP:molybdopterin cytidylyltransferase MocA
VAGVAGVVLAAGAGTRLRPLTLLRPKPLCPVGGVALVDLAMARVGAVADDVAVNVHHGRAAMEAHLGRRVHVSVEEGEALGTAGALGRLRPWVDGRPLVVVNADAWTTAPLAPLLDGWDGACIRVLVAGAAEVTPTMRLAGALLPWWAVEPLAAEPSGLWEVSWRAAVAAGRIEAVPIGRGVPFVDCGTPGAYLAANLAASGGAPVVGEGAVVAGRVERSVVWPGAAVHAGEHLVHAIRTDAGSTVLVR